MSDSPARADRTTSADPATLTTTAARRSGWRGLLEVLLAAAVLVSVVHVVSQFVVVGALPHPFHDDPSESLMDFYNTAYWANRDGAYTNWHTVYPPLTFLISRILTLQACYGGTSHGARACDPGAAWWIFAVYVVNAILVLLAFRRASKATAAPRALALSLSLPMLYSLELANFIILCFTFFVLAEGGLLRRPWAQSLCLAAAINFKPYLLIMVVPQVLRRDLRSLVGVGLAGLAIYLVTLAAYGSGTPAQLLNDVIIYTRGQSTIFAETNHLAAISARSHDAWNQFLPTVLRLGEAVALGGIVVGTLPKSETNGRLLSALAVSVVCSEAALHTQGFSADYTQVFLIFLIFLGGGPSVTHLIVVSLAYILCISADIQLLTAHSVDKLGYFSNRIVRVDFALSLSQFTRPLVLVLIQLGLCSLIWRERHLGRPQPDSSARTQSARRDEGTSQQEGLLLAEGDLPRR